MFSGKVGLRARGVRQHQNSNEEQTEIQYFGETNLDKSHNKLRIFKNELGFRHWLFVLVFVATVYMLMVWQDSKMPSIVHGNQFTKFSEERARATLNNLTVLGPRPSGSLALEKHAVDFLTNKISEVSKQSTNSLNRLELDIQRPTGCFDLNFLFAFSICYHKPTNILARLGPKSGPTNHSLLINCHFDTLPDTPGATDDAVSCAIMLEIMEVLALTPAVLKNDIIFLFNGAEESFLQGSHGFIGQHPWRHSIRAFINLEGCGSGGREILFQAGPGESWLIKTYFENAPYPHANVMAQEIFQSGIVPSDTDFRIFRDYGRISGLDIVYLKNGWVYHTEFDRPEFISEGVIQRSGENLLAITKAIIQSPYMERDANFEEANKWVFYDVVGLITVFYDVNTGVILNCATVALSFISVFYHIRRGRYGFSDLCLALFHHTTAVFAMILVGLVLVALIWQFNLSMAWYSMPELVFPIYILPMLTAAFWVHLKASRLKKGLSAEYCHYDFTLIFFSILLLCLTLAKIASAFFILSHLLFPMLRNPAIFLCRKLGIIEEVTPKTILYFQAFSLFPTIVYSSNAIMSAFEFFVPLMGRFGNLINPEFVIAGISLLVSNTLVLFTNNLIYISRRLDFLHKYLVAFSLLGLLLVFTTRIGNPYKFSHETPRVRRIISMHTRRTIHAFDGTVKKHETALFVQSMDYRGITDLPDHTFLHAADRPDCSQTLDLYCQLPYYTAINELFPPEQSLWVPLPTMPYIQRPLSVQLVSKKLLDSGKQNLTLLVSGGSDKMSIHVTPLNGYEFKQWSLTSFEPRHYKKRSTYFAFMTYGSEILENRTIWVTLENQNFTLDRSSVSAPVLEFAVATHYVHGERQNSETLLQLRKLIKKRRETPHAAVGYWRWGMTMIGGVAEIIVYTF